MKKIILLLFLVSCCPTISGPPGDASTLSWKPPKGTYVPETIIDCKGETREGTLNIRKSNTTVRNCKINGDIRVWGIARNANDPKLLKKSRIDKNYVSWVRDNAPKFVTIENTTINGTGTIPLYIGPGAVYTMVKNVKIIGYSKSTMVYLGAESHSTIIEDSFINAYNGLREAIAIDASNYNIIRNNTIQYAIGGIFLYRNCGEDGVVRHTTPSYNIIENNKFIGIGVSVWLGSREGNRCYCQKDHGWSFGSSISDMDHARYNKVVGNDLGNGTVLEGKTSHSNKIQN